MNESQTLERAKALMVGPFDWQNMPIEEVIRQVQTAIFMQTEIFDSTSGTGTPCPLNLLYAGQGGDPRPITLQIKVRRPVADVLELLAAIGSLILTYYNTGIMVWPEPPLEDVAEQVAAAAGKTHIPGMPLPEPPSTSVLSEPPPLPAPIAPLSEHEAAALAPVRDVIAGLVAKYPFIGEYGNSAGVRFFEFFHVFRDTGTDLEALVQLVTIYPTRAVRLPCDVSQ